MAGTAHVYQIFIAAQPEAVWQAITDSEWTKRYFHATSFVEPPSPGAAYRTVLADGGDAVEGLVEEMTPPKDGEPGRFVQTWHVLYDASLSAEPPGRVEWTVEGVGEGLTRVRLVHGDLAYSPLTWAHVKDGWVWILDGLKTLLETGRPLPSPAVLAPESATPEGDWHRRQGVEANNAAHGLLERERTPEIDEELLRHAYAAAYHWERATGARPENEARASYMVARALVATGQAERGLVSADRVLAVCTDHGITDFDLAYGHEARSRALSALGRTEEAALEASLARAVAVADPEDAAIVERDLQDLPIT
jgi:uncharacterized protein YndB with AHSA1/START domain